MYPICIRAIYSAVKEWRRAWSRAFTVGHSSAIGARALVAGVGLELDANGAEALEGMLEQQQLRLDVDAGAPDLAREPRPADLEPPMLGHDREVASRADREAVAQDGEDGVVLLRECVGEPVVEPRREPAPDRRVRSRRPQPLDMLRAKRLQRDEPALEP
jgi:hypothetical protein